MSGLFTLATAYAGSFMLLLLVRFIAGSGLGGATPCFIAVVSEYASPERRARVTSAIWTAFPVGNVIGTGLVAFLLARFNWEAIFVVGGVLPTRQASYGTLFAGANAIDTILLWIAFLTVFGVVAAVFYFAPALMHAHGVPLKVAALTLDLGGLGSLIERFGAGPVMATTPVIGAFGVALVGFVAGSVPLMAVPLAFLGVSVGGMSISGVLAPAAITYPAAIRSTGIGGAVGFGRLGQVIMPLVISLLQLIGLAASCIFLLVSPLLLVGAVAITALIRRQHRIGSIATRPATASAVGSLA